MYGSSAVDSPIDVIPPGLGFVRCRQSSVNASGAPASIYLNPSSQLVKQEKSEVFHAKSAIANKDVLDASACCKGLVTIPRKSVRPGLKIPSSAGPMTRRLWFTSFTGQFSHIKASFPALLLKFVKVFCDAGWHTHSPVHISSTSVRFLK